VPLPHYFFSLNWPSWSVSVELFFYLCFPFLISSARRSRALTVAAAAALVLVMMVVASFLGLESYKSNENVMSTTALLCFNPASRLLEFALGISLALGIERARRAQIAAAIATLLEAATVVAIFVSPQSFITTCESTTELFRSGSSIPGAAWRLPR
jgi:peptidoglycan/LPS O-acetylase OafA/YrhL